MMHATRVVAGAIGLLIGGCAAPPPVEPELPVTEPEVNVQPRLPAPVLVRPAVSDSDMLLAYFDQVRKLPPADFTRELELVRRLYANVKGRTDVLRMRYAMLLAASPALADDARAAELLDPVLKGADANVRGLALLLSAQLQEQRRVHALQQKLDALLSLDKTLIERGTKTP
jgi:hypothetical protein